MTRPQARFTAHLILALSFLLLAHPVGAAPTTIAIQGKLTGSTGKPLTGTRVWWVQFYDAVVAGNALGASQTGMVTLAPSGRFTIQVTPPPAVLAATGQIWYELAVDSAPTPDGTIDSVDVFSSRVKVSSTLWSQRAVLTDQATTATYSAQTGNALKLGGVAASGYATAANLTAALAGKADTAHSHLLQNLGGAVTDAQVPDTIMINYAKAAGTATTATTALAAVEHDTLDSVARRGASTNQELSLGGGVRLAPLASPASLAGRLLNTSATLYWDGRPLQPAQGPAFVTVQVTDNPTSNGLNLISAYNHARTLTPHGIPLSAANRAVVLVPPGRYDLGTRSLLLNTEFVDLVGLSSARDNQFITGITSGSGTGVLRQTADNVHLENLVVDCAYNGSYISGSDSPAAYFPDSSTTDTVVRNCAFQASGSNGWSTRLAIAYPGNYRDCVGGNGAFGGYGTASGTFTRCVGGSTAFGGVGTASGTFTDCTGGYMAFAGYGTASGTFTNCTGGVNAFGGADSGAVGRASGTFTNCTGGDYSFSGGNFCNASGTFINCTGAQYAFGSQPGGTASGLFINCTADYGSFGGYGASNSQARLQGCRMTNAYWMGTWAGKMQNCNWSANLTLAGSARLYNCTILGTLDLNNTAAGVTQCRAKSITNAASNTFGATNAAALNIASAAVNY